MNDESYPWATYLGAGIVVILFAAIALIAAGTWNWFSKFLESSAPAWVQAIGSVAAIFGSVAIANRQHRQKMEAEIAAAEKLNKHRNDIVYFSIEHLRETSAYIAERIDQSEIPSPALKDLYIGGRSSLANFPILEIQNPELARAVMEINQFSLLAEQIFSESLRSRSRRMGFDQIANQCVETQKMHWSHPPVRPSPVSIGL